MKTSWYIVFFGGSNQSTTSKEEFWVWNMTDFEAAKFSHIYVNGPHNTKKDAMIIADDLNDVLRILAR